jgi:hypothetical protein
MIPETGTSSELKQAWIESVAMPMVGEVYAWVDGAQFRECWKVTALSEPALRRITIDVYDQAHNGALIRRICGSNVHLGDWQNCIKSGAVRYVGMKVPYRVELW